MVERPETPKTYETHETREQAFESTREQKHDRTASDAVRFAALVRAVGAESRRLGLAVPGFRSPPRLAGVDRSLRRRPGSLPSVAVRLDGRTDEAVGADLVEGVIVANGLPGPAADQASPPAPGRPSPAAERPSGETTISRGAAMQWRSCCCRR